MKIINKDLVMFLFNFRCLVSYFNLKVNLFIKKFLLSIILFFIQSFIETYFTEGFNFSSVIKFMSE